VKKSQRASIDPYGLGFLVIIIGALFGGIQHSGDDNNQAGTTHNSPSTKQVADGAVSN